MFFPLAPVFFDSTISALRNNSSRLDSSVILASCHSLLSMAVREQAFHSTAAPRNVSCFQMEIRSLHPPRKARQGERLLLQSVTYNRQREEAEPDSTPYPKYRISFNDTRV